MAVRALSGSFCFHKKGLVDYLGEDHESTPESSFDCFIDPHSATKPLCLMSGQHEAIPAVKIPAVSLHPIPCGQKLAKNFHVTHQLYRLYRCFPRPHQLESKPSSSAPRQRQCDRRCFCRHRRRRRSWPEEAQGEGPPGKEREAHGSHRGWYRRSTKKKWMCMLIGRHPGPGWVDWSIFFQRYLGGLPIFILSQMDPNWRLAPPPKMTGMWGRCDVGLLGRSSSSQKQMALFFKYIQSRHL